MKHFENIKIPDPPKELRGLEHEIRMSQVMIQRLVWLPWQDKSPSFKVGLMSILVETCLALASLVIAQYELMPGMMKEFQRQVDEVIDEIVEGWEGTKDEGGRMKDEDPRVLGF